MEDSTLNGILLPSRPVTAAEIVNAEQMSYYFMLDERTNMAHTAGGGVVSLFDWLFD
jgi:hypothetical protein